LRAASPRAVAELGRGRDRGLALMMLEPYYELIDQWS